MADTAQGRDDQALALSRGEEALRREVILRQIGRRPAQVAMRERGRSDSGHFALYQVPEGPRKRRSSSRLGLRNKQPVLLNHSVDCFLQLRIKRVAVSRSRPRRRRRASRETSGAMNCLNTISIIPLTCKHSASFLRIALPAAREDIMSVHVPQEILRGYASDVSALAIGWPLVVQ
jgi:hypothetical protein